MPFDGGSRKPVLHAQRPLGTGEARWVKGLGALKKTKTLLQRRSQKGASSSRLTSDGAITQRAVVVSDFPSRSGWPCCGRATGLCFVRDSNTSGPRFLHL